MRDGYGNPILFVVGLFFWIALTERGVEEEDEEQEISVFNLI